MFAYDGITPVNGDVLYVEDVFSAYSYVGNGAAQTVTTEMDTTTDGGLVWIKRTSDSGFGHTLYDTVRGANNYLETHQNTASTALANSVTLSSTGFSIAATATRLNASSARYIAWTFVERPLFFDIVTWNGDSVYGRTISHGLGIQPGMIIVKRISGGVGSWLVYHRGLPSSKDVFVALESTTIVQANDYWAGIAPTSTGFSVKDDDYTNLTGSSYIAYLFAHDTSDEGIIQCGSYTGNGSSTGPTVTLGWEPQYVMIKRATGGTGNWLVFDTTRGLTVNNDSAQFPNTTSADSSGISYINPTATGFAINTVSTDVNSNTHTYIYMAIRKGNMRTPEDATKVFAINASTGTGATRTISGLSITQRPDLVITKQRSSTQTWNWQDTVRGTASQFTSVSTTVATTDTDRITSFNMDGITMSTDAVLNTSAATYINYFFKQARGFFDIVSYTGTGANRTISHNLGATPQLIIIKSLGAGAAATVFYFGSATAYAPLSSSSGGTTDSTYWNSTAPTDTVFSLGTNAVVNASSTNYIAYLFSSVPGVSTIGTYTGTGSTETIDCGFVPRFIFFKSVTIGSGSDSWVHDTTRGIVAGNDAHLRFNVTTAETTTDDYVDLTATGFQINTFVNSGQNYFYWAIA